MKKYSRHKKSAQEEARDLNLSPRKAPILTFQSLSRLAFFRRLLGAALLAGIGFVAFSNVQAQVWQPSAGEISPTVNTEVSSLIHTGCGYDAWTGSVHRSVTDLEVPGAVSSLGLKWVRTYNSGNHDNPWSFSWTWRYWGRNWGTDAITVHLPDGGLWRTIEPGMKLRFLRDGDDPVNGCSHDPANGCANLYLEDGSRVYMNRWTDLPEPDQQPPRDYPIDFYTPEYVVDPYGRQTTLTYEQVDAPGCGECYHIRLKQVTDPSGRFIRIRYANDNPTIWSDPSWAAIIRVEGSDGSWVNYTPDASAPTQVDYSDGTHAYYVYGNTTYLMDTECGCNPTCYNCTISSTVQKLIAAWDTHADSPMQSIYYQYKPNGRFEGQILAEKQLASATPTASPVAGVAVSTFTSNSCPTHPWSQSPDCPSATQTEYRGDGPSRTIYMQQAAQHVPLVKHKSDFNGINEIYTYDGNNYLTDVTDRNGYHTHYTNEQVVGNPTQILHNSDGTHVDYTYSDPNNPYHIHTVSDELQNVTTYTRDGNNRIIQVDYPDGASETFAYNNFGQVQKHRRKNYGPGVAAYDYAAYDNGLLTKLWSPTTTDYGNSLPPDTAPHITITYYGPRATPSPVPSPCSPPNTCVNPAPDPWQDRVQTVTYPVNCSGQVPTETYEYDRALDPNTGVTNPYGSPVPGRGLVTKITHADGNSKYFQYDKFGNKRWTVDETIHIVSYTYDDYKRLKTVTRYMSPAPNETTTYFYTASTGASPYSHTTNSVRQTWSPTNVITGQLYDNNFRLARRIEGEGSINATTWFGYDNNGNQTRVTDPRGSSLGDPQHTTVTGYDNRNRKHTITDALNHVTTLSYQGGSSNVTDIQRPDLTHESKTYDAMHRVLTDAVPQTSSVNLTTWFTYNPSGTLHTVIDPRGTDGHTYPNGDPNYTTSFLYNASDERVQMTYPDQSYRTWTYDDDHNLCHRRTPNTVRQDFAYDARNREISMQWANPNNVSNFTAEWASYDYDNASRLQTAINGTGAWNQNPISIVFRQYDFAGRLTLDQQNLVGLVGVGPENVNYTYRPDGTTRWLTVSGVSPTYAYMFDYDAMARFQTITYGGSVAFQYHYDAVNERQRDSVVNGVSQFYTYDNINRMTHVDVKKGNTLIGSEDYGHDDMSRLVSVTRDDNKQDWFSYYLDGELKTANYGASPTPTASPGDPGSPNGQCADPVFSQAGGCPYALLVSTSTATQGATIFYTSDPNGFVTPTHNGSSPTGSTLVYGGNILVPAGSAQFISAVAYNNGMDDSDVIQANMDNSCDLPAGADPNATPPPEDAAPTPDTSWTPEATPPPYQASNDPPPDVTPPPAETPPPSPPPVSDDTPPALDPGKEQKTVDDYISLKMDPEQMSPGVRDVTYNLDKMGNRTSVRDTGNTKPYMPNNLNEYSQAEGNPVTNNDQHQISQYGPVNSVVNYTYLNDEQLITAQAGNTTYQMLYDALGRCVQRTVNGLNKYYIYDGERPILEYDGGGNLVGRNVYGKGIDEILMRTDYTFPNQTLAPGVTFYHQQDHEGSVIHLTDTNGALLERYRYDAFGAPTIYPPSPSATPIQASAVSNRFLFTGREYAAAFGFYEYRARAYHPGLGRFTGEDPKLFEAGDYNLFRYCRNDPLDITDPMGLYGMGSGWNPELWKQFNQAQKIAAQQLSSASAKIDNALKAGKDSNTFKSESSAFERTFGKGTGTAEKMSNVSGIMKQMVTALRDDGSKGYIANGMSAKEFMQIRGTDRDTVAAGVTPGKIIYVNVENRKFDRESMLSWAVGHESAHNIGLEHGKLNGVVAYKYGSDEQRNAYKALPLVAPSEALHNPDNLMDFAR